MKIQLQFIEDPREAVPGTIAMVGSSAQPEELIKYSLERQAVLIGGPMEWEDRYGMVCAVKGRLTFQSMCFLSPEQRERYVPGTDVEVIPTPFGKIGLCCGEDIFQPMYPRLAALKGCVLLAVGGAPMDHRLLMAGPWSACQSNCLPIALWGQLILPCAMTADRSGFGGSSFHTGALEEAYREFPIFKSLNSGFYRRYREVLER